MSIPFGTPSPSQSPVGIAVGSGSQGFCGSDIPVGTDGVFGLSIPVVSSQSVYPSPSESIKEIKVCVGSHGLLGSLIGFNGSGLSGVFGSSTPVLSSQSVSPSLSVSVRSEHPTIIVTNALSQTIGASVAHTSYSNVYVPGGVVGNVMSPFELIVVPAGNPPKSSIVGSSDKVSVKSTPFIVSVPFALSVNILPANPPIKLSIVVPVKSSSFAIITVEVTSKYISAVEQFVGSVT